jgi:hypothetical protein
MLGRFRFTRLLVEEAGICGRLDGKWKFFYYSKKRDTTLRVDHRGGRMSLLLNHDLK